jgi:hypothetical protein
MRLAVGMLLGWLVTVVVFVHGALDQGAVLTWQTWPAFAVIGLPVALLGGVASMLLFALIRVP